MVKQRERTKKEQKMDNQRTYEQMEGISISAKAKEVFRRKPYDIGKHSINRQVEV